MSKKKTLQDIFDDDDFGLLDSKPINSSIKTEEDRLIESFLEINAFFEKNKREPKADIFVVAERNLGAKLKNFRNNTKHIEVLKPYDKHNLLGIVKKEITTVDDIFSDDTLGILDTDETLEIFKIKNIPSDAERAETDFVARRKALKPKEFAFYEPMFKKVQKELKEGKRKLTEFKLIEQNLEQGKYYILDGVLLYLKNDGAKDRLIKDRVRKDGRTTIIFENGTTSNMYYRSLAKALYNNGKIVSDTDSESENELFKNVNLVNESDEESGWIYILKSKSTNKAIQEIKDLYKIGFSKIDVRDRIKNASKESTYLMADVEIVSTYKCYNINPHKFEQLIHRFFAEVCLNVDVYDDKGKRITPREWFVAPINIIDKTINLVLSGEIINYSYNSKTKTFEKKTLN